MIVDFHTHVDEAEAFGWIDPPEKIVELLDDAAIDRAVIMTYTDLPGMNAKALDYIVESAERFSDRLIPFVRLNPNYRKDVPGLVAEAVARGVRGIKLHPTTTLAHPVGSATLDLLALAGDAGLPVLFHCGDDPYTTPQTLALAAAAVPECTVVFGHMGGYAHVKDAIEAARKQHNIVLETSAMPYPALISKAVEVIGAERVVFGSDGPGCNPRLELAKITGLGLEPADERAILGGNAARLLGLDRA
ncbi:MAG TPA: amidohydrolase family protein [Microbacteriaceae bacterium]|nr:amidohydrolase family protein [Microbacteriaceae bacterium]